MNYMLNVKYYSWLNPKQSQTYIICPLPNTAYTYNWNSAIHSEPGWCCKRLVDLSSWSESRNFLQVLLLFFLSYFTKPASDWIWFILSLSDPSHYTQRPIAKYTILVVTLRDCWTILKKQLNEFHITNFNV